jgi:hypothetical protein
MLELTVKDIGFLNTVVLNECVGEFVEPEQLRLRQQFLLFQAPLALLRLFLLLQQHRGNDGS